MQPRPRQARESGDQAPILPVVRESEAVPSIGVIEALDELTDRAQEVVDLLGRVRRLTLCRPYALNLGLGV